MFKWSWFESARYISSAICYNVRPTLKCLQLFVICSFVSLLQDVKELATLLPDARKWFNRKFFPDYFSFSIILCFQFSSAQHWHWKPIQRIYGFFSHLFFLFNLIFLGANERMLFAQLRLLYWSVSKFKNCSIIKGQKPSSKIIACNQHDLHQDVVITGVCMRLIVQFRIK